MPSFQLEWSAGSNLINQFDQLSLTIAPVVLLLSKPDRVMNSDPCLSFIIMRGRNTFPISIVSPNSFVQVQCQQTGPLDQNRPQGGKFPFISAASDQIKWDLPRNITLFSLLVHMAVVLADRGELLCFLWYRLRIMMTSRQQKWCDQKNESDDGEY